MKTKLILSGFGLTLSLAMGATALATKLPLTINVMNQTNLVCDQQGTISSCKPVEGYNGVTLETMKTIKAGKNPVTIFIKVGETNQASFYDIFGIKGVNFVVRHHVQKFNKPLFTFTKDLVNNGQYRLYTFTKDNKYSIGLAKK